MKVGRYTYGTEHITLHWESSGHELVIGNFCSIALNLHVYLGGNHRVDWFTTYPFGYVNQPFFNVRHPPNDHPSSKGGVVIGNDVWIADNVTIMSGIHVADGVVIAANSHVVKNCDEPYGIYGGNPARLIKKRFSKEVIDKLMELKWWDMPEEGINRIISILCSDKVEDLLNINK